MQIKHPNVLSIAGIDPSGGAGLLADVKTISSLGGYATGVVTAATGTEYARRFRRDSHSDRFCQKAD